VIGKRNIPVIPFFTNVYVPPLPDAAALRGARQGDREDRRGRPADEKVAIIASGGMSHFPGTTKYLHPEFDFDRWLVSQMEAGNASALLDMTGTQLDEVGNTEMLSWAVLYGLIGAQQGELIDYIPTWHHGLCMMRFLPARARTTEPMKVGQEFGGFQFQNQGFQFYKHPPSEAYGPEQAALRVAPQRARCATASSTTSRTSPTSTTCTGAARAAKSMINVGSGGLVSEHVGPLASAGAHPLQALMALHVIFSNNHKRGQAAMAGETLDVFPCRLKPLA
jgi:hypothetical protein